MASLLSSQSLRALRLGVALCISAFVLMVHSAPSRAMAAPVQVTTGGGFSPTVSRDGVWIAYKKSGVVTKMPTAGGPEEAIAPGSYPDWGPGDLIAAISGPIVILDAVTHTSTPLSAEANNGVSWSPDGLHIAAQTVSGGDSLSLFDYPLGPQYGLPCLAPDASSCAGEGPTWAPDNQSLAFEDAREIEIVPVQGGQATLLYSSPTDVTEPAWSPDGNWVAFAQGYNSLGGISIWAVHRNGSAFGLVQVTDDGSWYDREPAWAPDGQTLYFASNRTGGYEIWKVAFAPVAAPRKSWGFIKSLYR